MAMTVYPLREKFFALRFTRLMTKRCLAQDAGAVGTWLLTVIVHQEDAAHYRRGVTFYDGQLMPLLGINSKKTMTAIRKKLVEAGWLHFEPGHKGKASTYWVLIPKDATALDDLPTDEGPQRIGSQLEPQTTDSVPLRNLNGHTSGTERGALLPNPKPNPHQYPAGDGEMKDPFERADPCPAILKLLPGISMPIIAAAWRISKQFATLNPQRRSIDTAAKIVKRFAGCISANRAQAPKRLEDYYSLEDPDLWQREVVEGTRLEIGAPPLDVCRHLFPKSAIASVRTNGSLRLTNSTEVRITAQKIGQEMLNSGKSLPEVKAFLTDKFGQDIARIAFQFSGWSENNVRAEQSSKDLVSQVQASFDTRRCGTS